MSDSVSVGGPLEQCEPDLNYIVKEYLYFCGYEKSVTAFEKECLERRKSIQPFKLEERVDDPNLTVVKVMLGYFSQGKRREFFDLWYKHIPEKLLRKELLTIRCECLAYIHFAIYPLQHGSTPKEAKRAMADLKQYLDTKGVILSHLQELLPYFALPFVQDLINNPKFKNLFEEDWVVQLYSELKNYLSITLAAEQPHLYYFYKTCSRKIRVLQKKLQTMKERFLELENRLSDYKERHRIVQADYYSLIGITADLVDSLEDSVRGTVITPERLWKICQYLFSGHLRLSVDLKQRGLAGNTLRASAQQRMKLADLDYAEIKHDLILASGELIPTLLQALRWRITRTSLEQSRKTLALYVQNDLLGSNDQHDYQAKILKFFSSEDGRVKESIARLFNAVASYYSGRGYLAKNSELLVTLLQTMYKSNMSTVTAEMIMALLTKLSLRPFFQTALIQAGVIEWLVDVLEKHLNTDILSEYMLEHSFSLLMNLSLRTSGRKRCIDITDRMLTVLIDNLGHENAEIRPYINGALYSIVLVPSIREKAKQRSLEENLRAYYKEGADHHDENRQLDVIISRLNSEDTVNDIESDDEDDDNEEEDNAEETDFTEPQLDENDSVIPLLGVLSGEDLLMSKYLLHSPQRPHSAKTRRQGSVQAFAAQSATVPLPSSHPSTPDSKRDKNSFRPDSLLRTSRPPTRSGSRPVTRGATTPVSGERESQLTEKSTSVRSPAESKKSLSTLSSMNDEQSSPRKSPEESKKSTMAKTAVKEKPKLELSEDDQKELEMAFGTSLKMQFSPPPSRDNNLTQSLKRSNMSPPSPKYSASGPQSSSGKSELKNSTKKVTPSPLQSRT